MLNTFLRNFWGFKANLLFLFFVGYLTKSLSKEGKEFSAWLKQMIAISMAGQKHLLNP